MITLQQVVKDCNLDTLADLEDYLYSFAYATVSSHRVVLAICKDGDTFFTVDGCEQCWGDISPSEGAKILRWLLGAWKGLDKPSTCFCYPVDTDNRFLKRMRMFKIAGFTSDTQDPNKLIYAN